MRDGVPGLLAQVAPRSLTREGRVLLLAEVARALLDNRMPDAEARAFIGSALMAFLQNGGSLERHLRIGAKKGSHRTARHVFHSVIARSDKPGDLALSSAEVDNEGPNP